MRKLRSPRRPSRSRPRNPRSEPALVIRINPNADPFSGKARVDSDRPEDRQHLLQPILASSAAGRLLKNEMRRYCDGEVKGRSFLIAGHRGAGKTTMVDNTVLELARRALNGPGMKPLPVYLLGPLLLEDKKLDDDGHPATTTGTTAKPAGLGSSDPRVSLAVNVTGASVSVAPAKTAAVEEEKLMTKVLIQVVLAIHQAVSTEFVEQFRRLALTSPAQHPGDARAAELRELAARFAIELTEGPPPARLQQFWELAGATEHGMLFDGGRYADQGMRELVALTGVSHAHQRVSGELREQQDQKTGRVKSTESSLGLAAKGEDILKPLAAILSGAVVAAGSAASSAAGGGIARPILLGLLTALGAGAFLRFTSTTTVKRERNIDRTFIPDFSIRTLNRVIPALIDRLKAAGLAPVFVVDELDKVDNLSDRIYPLIRNLKKLFAESSFTCLLVDRGFYENLLIREQIEQGVGPATPASGADPTVRQAALGRNFSYFSHRIFVAFEPAELHDYLRRLLEVSDG